MAVIAELQREEEKAEVGAIVDTIADLQERGDIVEVIAEIQQQEEKAEVEQIVDAVADLQRRRS